MPKPLIDVHGKPMIARVIENVGMENVSLILIARLTDGQAYPDVFSWLESHYGCCFIFIDKPTEGAACTALHAVSSINNDTPLLLVNSDQLIDCPMTQFVADAQERTLDGSILTFHEAGRDPKWSYASVDDKGLVMETREKVAISSHATVGVYWFAKGKYFVEAATSMIAHNDRCNNEFYICPAYNYLIRQGQRIGIYEIPKTQMHGLGTPEDLSAYLQSNP